MRTLVLLILLSVVTLAIISKTIANKEQNVNLPIFNISFKIGLSIVQ